MFARFTGLLLAKSKEPKFDKFLENEIRNSHYLRFIRYPWFIWDCSFIIFLVAIYVTYLIYTEDIKNVITIGMNVFLYYIYFFIIYATKIERVVIDKKKGIIKYALINCFLSKEEYARKINDLQDIEILRKGIIRRGHDTTKFYIRLSFKNNTPIIFGESLSWLKIEMKYRKCAAILKGIIIPDIISYDFVTDETIDETKEK